MMKITAYADRISAAPGETINFMVNCEAKTFKADFVRLICGDMNPDGPGYQERVVRTPANGTYKGRRQVIHAGSFVEVPNAAQLQKLESFTVQAFIWPTTPDRGEQTLIASWSESGQSGMALSIAADGGGLALTLGGGRGKVETFKTGRALLAHEWYFVAASFDAERRPHALAIAEMALENYDEMRDTVRDPAFERRAALAFELERRFPGRFIPRYSMVMFHPEIGYAEAQRRGRIQAELLALALAEPDSEAALVRASSLVEQML